MQAELHHKSMDFFYTIRSFVMATPQIFRLVVLTLLLLLTENLQAADIPLIQSLNITQNSMKVIAEDEFKENYLLENFFVEYDQDIDLSSLDESLVIVPFIANVISIIWISNKTYVIPSLDKDFFDSLERLKKVFKIFYPKTRWDGELKVLKLVKNRTDEIKQQDYPQMALTFSLGLDSVFHLYNTVIKNNCSLQDGDKLISR